MFKIKKKLEKSPLLKKVLWTVAVAFVYMLGRAIPIPIVQLNQSLFAANNDPRLVENFGAVTGLQLNEMTLFSIGLSPWMTAMIIWRFFTVFNLLKKLPSAKMQRYRMLLTLVVALIQAFGLSAGTQYQEIAGFSNLSLRLMTILVLITGSFVLIWLGNLNSERGLGGMTVIILVNMILSFQSNVTQFLFGNNLGTEGLLIAGFIFCLALSVLSLLAIILYRGEYRIPIRRVGINSPYHESSYLPIRVTPAGAMPFMYGMTLMMLPPYILAGLLNFFPGNEFLVFLSTNIGISQTPGALVYIVLLYFLAIGFSYFNYDSFDIAKNMQKSGDYITGVLPGKPTRKYIQQIINRLAHFGAITVVLLGGLPLLVTTLQSGGSGEVSLALLVSNAYIIVSLLLGVVEQVNSMQSWKQYKELI